MPELPEVETIRRGLTERLAGQTITGVRVRQAQLRHLVDVAALQEHAIGRTIISVDRRAKYLLVRLHRSCASPASGDDRAPVGRASDRPGCTARSSHFLPGTGLRATLS